MKAPEPPAPSPIPRPQLGHAEVIRQLDGVLKQRSLPRADLSLHDQRSAHPGSNRVEQVLNGRPMLAAVNQRKPLPLALTS